MIANKLYLNHNLWESIYAGDLEKLPWLTNPIPHDIFEEFKSNIGGNKRLLDYGCGNGRLADIFTRDNVTVTCADISQNALELCKKQAISANLVKTEMPNCFANDSFDAILCWGVLHHIAPHYRYKFMEEFKRTIPKESLMLIGGWSDKDCEFQTENRISSITQSETWAMGTDMDKIIEALGLNIEKKNHFRFKESVTQKERIFVYYLLKK